MRPVVETSHWHITVHNAPEYSPYYCLGDPKISGSFELKCTSKVRSGKLFGGGTIDLILIKDGTRIKLPKALLIGVTIHDECRQKWYGSIAECEFIAEEMVYLDKPLNKKGAV